MGEDEVKGTIMYRDENLGEWLELGKVTEIPEIEVSREPVDEDYMPRIDLHDSVNFEIEVELPNFKDRGPFRRAYFKLCVAWFSGDRRKIKRAKRNFKKAKERYLKEKEIKK